MIYEGCLRNLYSYKTPVCLSPNCELDTSHLGHLYYLCLVVKIEQLDTIIQVRFMKTNIELMLPLILELWNSLQLNTSRHSSVYTWCFYIYIEEIEYVFILTFRTFILVFKTLHELFVNAQV